MKTNLTFASIFMVLVALVFVSSAEATKNPQIRQCHTLGGIFLVAKDLANDPENEFGFCQFDEAIIGTVDLLRHADGTDPVISIEIYASSVQSCEPYGYQVAFTDFEGNTIKVCAFSDGSLIGFETLAAGLRAPANQKLNDALGFN